MLNTISGMKRQFMVAGLALSLLFPTLLQGQEIGLLRLTPNQPAVQGGASVWGGYEIGGYHPTYGAASLWKAGADATGTRHGEKTTWTGTLSFGQTVGKEMLSSLFLEPDYFPLDVLEFMPGTKSRQDVRLEGGFVRESGYEWAFGLKAALKAANSSKRENLGHTATGLSLRLEPTVTYVMDDGWGLATAYIFGLRTESIKANGGAAEGANVFFDKRMRYGYYQDWAGFGTLSAQEMTNGIATRFHSPEFSFGLQGLWKRGTIGDQYRYPGSDISAFVEGLVQGDGTDHLYRFSLGRQADDLKELTSGGYYNAISGRAGWNLEMSYGFGWENGVLRKIQLGLDGSRWAESYLGYPFYDRTKRLLGLATLLTDFSFGPMDLELYVKGGRGWWQDHGLDNAQEEGAPDRLSEDWLRKMEYVRLLRGELGGFVTYHIDAVKGLYVRADASWTRAFHIRYLPGHHRVTFLLKAGYDF